MRLYTPLQNTKRHIFFHEFTLFIAWRKQKGTHQNVSLYPLCIFFMWLPNEPLQEVGKNSFSFSCWKRSRGKEERKKGMNKKIAFRVGNGFCHKNVCLIKFHSLILILILFYLKNRALVYAVHALYNVVCSKVMGMKITFSLFLFIFSHSFFSS